MQYVHSIFALDEVKKFYTRRARVDKEPKRSSAEIAALNAPPPPSGLVPLARAVAPQGLGEMGTLPTWGRRASGALTPGFMPTPLRGFVEWQLVPERSRGPSCKPSGVALR